MNQQRKIALMNKTTKILLSLLLAACTAMRAFPAGDTGAGLKSYEHVPHAGLFEIQPLHAWPFMPPRYRVYRPGADEASNVAQLANVVSCNRFGLPVSWFCFDYPLAGKYEVIGDQSPEIVTTTGVRKIRTQAGRSVTIEVNSAKRGILPDGSQVTPFSFEELLSKTAFGGRCQSELENLESNPGVPGAARLWGLRRISAKGDLIWQQVYLIKRLGGIVKNSGEVLAVDPTIGFNSFVFPTASRFAYAATSNVPFYKATPGGDFVDPKTREELATPVVAIDLATGLPVTDGPGVRSVSANELIEAYASRFAKRAAPEPPAGDECPIETSDSGQLSASAQAAISSLFH